VFFSPGDEVKHGCPPFHPCKCKSSATQFNMFRRPFAAVAVMLLSAVRKIPQCMRKRPRAAVVRSWVSMRSTARWLGVQGTTVALFADEW